MFLHAFLILTLHLHRCHVESRTFMQPQYVCLNDKGVGLLYAGGYYSNLNDNNAKINPDGNCQCSKENKFSCKTSPSKTNQLPQGQLTCGNEFGCPEELKDITYICNSGFPIAVLHSDGGILGRGSLKADGKCQCNRTVLTCNKEPTGKNTLELWDSKTCGTQHDCGEEM
ncbi:hypothetical protein O181_051314 [Austropuccinia psidii MF-1]|uniref:Uncharacterized protein n=1 Tax=Austropuccinia psidii MF-1 TaxID=1389203 RepID=A0A9Q3HQL1_9BASI|nr:hypothetical protein [Austropuccinia psidii MF-1]